MRPTYQIPNGTRGVQDAHMIPSHPRPQDSMTEVLRSADLLDYTAEEGVRVLGQGKLLNSDSFPGNGRNKLCMVGSHTRSPKG